MMTSSLLLGLLVALAGLTDANIIEQRSNDTRRHCINAPPSREPPRLGPPQRQGKGGGRQKRSLTCGTQPTMHAEQAKEAVYAHNKFRSAEAAANMLEMTWSDEMAAVAQAWADQCNWEHGGLYDCSGTRVGQNLFIETSSAGFPALNITYAVKVWNDERNDWNFATGMCNANKVCGHWTQVAWARTGQVGCAYKNCETMNVGGSVWKNALFVVCDYTEHGNVAGQLPFIEGEKCTQCDTEHTGHGFHCTDLCKQCIPGSDNSCGCSEVLTCQNGGSWDESTCDCVCPDKFTGLHCEECAEELYCLNGGTWDKDTCSCQCLEKEFHGNQCEYPCSCDDQDQFCPQWTAFCTDPLYSKFMHDNCITTCSYECNLPESCGV